MLDNNNRENKINERRKKIQNYIRALKALLCLRRMIMEKLSGNFYFGSKLNYKNTDGRDPQTPDFIVQLSDSVWVGEIKKALPDPIKFSSEEEYIRKVIEENIITQLKKYDELFKEIETDKHDLVLMAPSRDIEAIGILKIKYLEKKEQSGERLFRNNFALIVFSIEQGANNNEFIIIRLDYGNLENKNALDILRIGYKKMLSEIKEDLAKFKIYEETDKTPIEYVMVLLWTEIFPEIIDKGSVEKIIEWKDKKEHIFEVKLDDLMEYLHKMYTLPSLSENDKKQFTTKLVLDAMRMFSKVKFRSERTGEYEPAVTIREENGIIVFRVVYRTLPEKEELNYILKCIYSKEEETEEQEQSIPQDIRDQSTLDKWLQK